jgi:hypothetical protein
MMKIIHRGIIKFAPGKMAEGMELLQKMLTVGSRSGAGPWKCYRPSIGGGDVGHTVICETEWDSLAAVEAAWAKPDPEMQALMQKYDAIVESHTVEWYTPIQLEQG